MVFVLCKYLWMSVYATYVVAHGAQKRDLDFMNLELQTAISKPPDMCDGNKIWFSGRKRSTLSG